MNEQERNNFFSDDPQITVIVPFYNSQGTISDCLEAISCQYTKASEIILVDNGSLDGSAATVRWFKDSHPDLNIVLFNEPKRGPSAARNKGLRKATGDILFFTDSDCLPQAKWLEELLKGFSNPKIGAVAGQIIGAKGKNLLEKFHSLFTLKGLQKEKIFSEFILVSGGFPAANFAVRKSVFKKVGFFDEKLNFGEDHDFCARIYKSGYFIKYMPSAVVYHKHRNTLKGTWRQSIGFGTGHAALLKKHFRQMLIIDLPKYQYLSMNWPFRAWIDLAGADKKIFILILFSLVWWPLSCLLVFYFISLYRDMERRLRKNGLQANFCEKYRLVLLLIFKSAAMTMGRVVGSFRNRILCI